MHRVRHRIPKAVAVGLEATWLVGLAAFAGTWTYIIGTLLVSR
jgi:hypothetical protein